MARTSKLAQLKNSYNNQSASLNAQLAESRLAYFAHGERIYFFMLFIILFIVVVSLLIAWAAGAFDPLDKAIQNDDAKKVCGDGKVCDKGFTCKNGVCDKNVQDGDPCEGVQLTACQKCDGGKATENNFASDTNCWTWEWFVVAGIPSLILIGIGVLVLRKWVVNFNLRENEKYEQDTRTLNALESYGKLTKKQQEGLAEINKRREAEAWQNIEREPRKGKISIRKGNRARIAKE